jgi:hypothetical protein
MLKRCDGMKFMRNSRKSRQVTDRGGDELESAILDEMADDEITEK